MDSKLIFLLASSKVPHEIIGSSVRWATWTSRRSQLMLATVIYVSGRLHEFLI